MAEVNGVYSPNDVTLIVQTRTMQGVADGSFIEVERNKPDEFSTKIGAKGEGTFVENLDKSGSVKIHIKQNAFAEQEFLRGLLNSKSIFPINIVRSRDGHSEKVTCVNCMVKTSPRKSFSQDEETRVWEFSTIKVIENDTAG